MPNQAATPKTGHDQSRVEIQQLIDRWLAAIRGMDLEHLMSCYASELVAYDMMPPLEYRGADAYAKAWEMGLSTTKSFEIELRDVVIVARSDIGYAHALTHCEVETQDGQSMKLWYRWTAGFGRIDGVWKIVHEHSSVPLDMETDRALVDLEP